MSYLIFLIVSNFRWLAKQENGCSDIIDLGKARLRQISNSLIEQEVNAATLILNSGKCIVGSLLKRFQGTIVFSLYLFQKYQTY